MHPDHGIVIDTEAENPYREKQARARGFAHAPITVHSEERGSGITSPSPWGGVDGGRTYILKAFGPRLQMACGRP